jgi:16S rRNA (cytosine1402-N4)-methyltransferase
MTKKKNIPVEGDKPGDLSAAVYHIPVLFQECLDALNIKEDGVYVDCTFGGGGHSKGILSKLGPEGKLIAFDQDTDAKRNLPSDSRVLFVPQNFRHLQRFLRLHRIDKVDGVLADLGVSSHQFDEAERGFSIRFDADLDMRMDQREGKTAKDILMNFSELQLQKMFEKYGEVTNAKTLARVIVAERGKQPMNTINQFKALLNPVVKGNPNKYFAQVFQALRIEVNDELGALKEMLEQLPAVVKEGGRVAVITFHSLEDRVVKNYFKKGTTQEEEDDDNPFENKKVEKLWNLVNKKPILPAENEMKMNSRSRSSKLRVAEKI